MDRSRPLSMVLNHVRSGLATTRPALVRQTDLGRSLVNQRVEDAIGVGLIEEADGGVSTGGRPTKTLRMRADTGVLLSAILGESRATVSVSNLRGEIVASREAEWSVDDGPDAAVEQVTATGRSLLGGDEQRLWAVTAGVPAPVDVAAGVPVFPRMLPQWAGYPLRARLEDVFGVPVFIDNDVNLMALGSWQSLRREVPGDVVFVKAGTGIGAGIVANGQLIRGARGAAGDFGHTVIGEYSRVECRCGNFGCLEALAGGWALARDAHTAAFTRGSTFLQERIITVGRLTAADIVAGANLGDHVSQELITRSGELIGASLATVANLLNPDTLLIGGTLAGAGQTFFDPIEAQVRRRTLPLTSDELTIHAAMLDNQEGIIGASALALDMLLEPRMLARWLPHRSPRGLSASSTTAERRAPAPHAPADAYL